MFLKTFLAILVIQVSLTECCMSEDLFEEFEGVLYPPSGTLVSLPAIKTLSSKTTGLYLAEQDLGDDDLRDITTHFPHLENLYVGDNKFSDEGMRFLGAVTSLADLSIPHMTLTGKGIAHLSPLTGLKTLDARCLYLGNDGINILSTTLPLVEELDMTACGFDASALPYFKNMLGLKSLKLSMHKIDSSAMQDFKQWADTKGIEVSDGS